MLDPNLVRNEPDVVRQAVLDKSMDPEQADVDRVLDLDRRWRETTSRVQELQAERNRISPQIGELKRKGEDADDLLAQVARIKEELGELEPRERELEEQLEEARSWLPNIPADDAPRGGEDANRVLKEVGDKPAFDFEPRDHIELGEGLRAFEWERSSKLAGSGFSVFRGVGSRLSRALVNWFMDVHVDEHGYTEILPPYLVRDEVLHGTGQLPKLADDMYRVERDDLWLIPTAEVPVTNLHRGEVLADDDLPVRYVAYSACFRREAGAYGKDTRGLMRVHQFDKVELVWFTRPEDGPEAHETLTRHAEVLLERLGLTYRRVELATADLSFAAHRCFDLECWSPGLDRWLEVSSCSTFTDFQARRADIRHRNEEGKVGPVHTLNGSGLALPRTVSCLLETHQQADGSVAVPESLQRYMGTDVLRPVADD